MLKPNECLQDAMGHIDESLICEAERHIKKKKPWKKWLSAAACAGLTCAIAVSAAVYLQKGEQPEESSGETAGNLSGISWLDDREKKEYTLNSGELAYLYPWDCLTVYEQYVFLTYGGIQYSAVGCETEEEWLGGKLGDATAWGENHSDENRICELDCTVYTLREISAENYVAVKYKGEDGFYLFSACEYNPPQTLGELIDELNLTETLPFSRLYVNGERFALTDGASEHLWKLLTDCSAAPFTEQNGGENSEGVSFAIFSDVLGVRNLSWSVTRDGFLRTNIERFGYRFEIGTEAANAIIDYALQHKEKEPKGNGYVLIGTVTEIGKEYIVVDDSVLMADPAQGVKFTVQANFRELQKLIDSGYLDVGATVLVSCGGLDPEAPNHITNAFSIEEVRIQWDAGDDQGISGVSGVAVMPIPE